MNGFVKYQGGPAFPQGHPEMTMPGQSVQETQGMTLRDYFAAQALAGLMANAVGMSAATPEADATFCYTMADAMLAARAK